jgi:hypothetical protein
MSRMQIDLCNNTSLIVGCRHRKGDQPSAVPYFAKEISHIAARECALLWLIYGTLVWGLFPVRELVQMQARQGPNAAYVGPLKSVKHNSVKGLMVSPCRKQMAAEISVPSGLAKN